MNVQQMERWRQMTGMAPFNVQASVAMQAEAAELRANETMAKLADAVDRLLRDGITARSTMF
jgi:hypothetical protein